MNFPAIPTSFSTPTDRLRPTNSPGSTLLVPPNPTSPSAESTVPTETFQVTIPSFNPPAAVANVESAPGISESSVSAPTPKVPAREGTRSGTSPGTLIMVEAPTTATTTVASAAPQKFNAKEVESYYITTGPDGEPSMTDAARAVYAMVKTQFLDEVPKAPFGSPTIYMTGGLPGSGKGSILEELAKTSKLEFVLVDPDEIKKKVIADLATKNPALVPEMMKDENWAAAVHETSSLLAKELLKDALKSGKDVIYDSLMATPNQDKYRDIAAQARKDGYQVQALISNVTVDKAIQRATSRAQVPVQVELPNQGSLQLPGRLVDSKIIRSSDGQLRENLHQYVSEGLFDRMTVFNNNTDGKPAQKQAVYTRETAGSGFCSKLEWGET